MATLTSLRGDLRNDLQDTGSVVWSDALLNRAIDKAVEEYGQVAPIVAATTTNGVDAQRRYDLSATSGLLWLEAVEYVIDQDPKSFLPFQEESRGVLYILGDTLPLTGTNNLKVWYAKVHTVDASGSTLPVQDEELVQSGAYAHAILMRAAATIGTINPSSWTPRQARDLAELRRREFRDGLERRRTQRSAPLWRPAWGSTPRGWATV